MRLYEGKIGFTVFSGLVCHLRLFPRRQLRLERIGDLLGEIALDRKDISELAVVIFRPKVLVVLSVDQLHGHAHAIADAANAALQKGCNAECLSDFTNVGSFSSIWHHRGPGNHFEIAYLG